MAQNHVGRGKLSTGRIRSLFHIANALRRWRAGPEGTSDTKNLGRG